MFRSTNLLTCALAAATFLGGVAVAGPTYAKTATPVTAEGSGSTSPMDRVEGRITSLHSKLHITAAQEGQWTVVAQAMRDNAKSMDALIKDRTAHAASMTAIDNLRSYEKLAEAHEDGLKKFIPVFQSLYDTLSDSQKKSADVAFRGSHGKHQKS